MDRTMVHHRRHVCSVMLDAPGLAATNLGAVRRIAGGAQACNPHLLVAAVSTGYYYYRVTGNPFRMTYLVNRDTYAITPYFLFQSPRPEPAYHHAAMREFYRWELANDYLPGRSLKGCLSKIGDRLA